MTRDERYKATMRHRCVIARGAMEKASAEGLLSFSLGFLLPEELKKEWDMEEYTVILYPEVGMTKVSWG